MAKLLRQTDKEYFSIGEVDIKKESELVISNSLLKKIHTRGLYDVLVLNNEEVISDQLQERFDLGSAVHCRILEPMDFDGRFYIADKADPFHGGKRISNDDWEFMDKAIVNINKKYPELMDGANAEITITWEQGGVRCKMKADKIVRHTQGIDVYDIKTTYLNIFKQNKTPSGDMWELRKALCSLGYDLQAHFYKLGVEAWAREQGILGEINFYFTVISTDTSDVQMFSIGPKMQESGKEKFDFVWNDVKDFVHHGKDFLRKDIEL